MARSIKRSLVRKAEAPTATDGPDRDEKLDAAPTVFRRATKGSGSAWNAGAIAQAQAGIDEAREDLAQNILSGDRILEIDPAMIIDPIGSDRRSDWMDQEEFLSFVESIREHGQETPIGVWPKDHDWRPDPIDPANLERVQFLLLAGRRRTEAARRLNRPVRAVIASQECRGGDENTFEMLAFRFRENDEREGLSAFERLSSIGQMYDVLSEASSEKVKAKEFARRVGVHESTVSRARAVYGSRNEILNAFKNVYDMSFRELQNAMAELAQNNATGRKKPKAKPSKLRIMRKIGARNLAVEAGDGKLSIKTTGVKLDKDSLETLGDLVARFLEEHRAKVDAGQ